jgi:hypothetical protein
MRTTIHYNLPDLPQRRENGVRAARGMQNGTASSARTFEMCGSAQPASVVPSMAWYFLKRKHHCHCQLSVSSANNNYEYYVR